MEIIDGLVEAFNGISIAAVHEFNYDLGDSIGIRSSTRTALCKLLRIEKADITLRAQVREIMPLHQLERNAECLPQARASHTRFSLTFEAR